jgi:hypothetical protein
MKNFPGERKHYISLELVGTPNIILLEIEQKLQYGAPLRFLKS